MPQKRPLCSRASGTLQQPARARESGVLSARCRLTQSLRRAADSGKHKFYEPSGAINVANADYQDELCAGDGWGLSYLQDKIPDHAQSSRRRVLPFRG